MIREKHKRTVQRLQWLVQVRWLVVVAVILFPMLFYFSKRIPLRITPFYFIGGVAFFYNLLVWLYAQKIERDHSAVINSPEVNIFINTQIITDYLLLTASIYFSGGVMSPLVFFFTFHMLTACILLSPHYGYLYSSFALLLVLAVGILQYYHLVPNTGLAALLSLDMSNNPLLIVVVIMLAASTLYLTNYLISKFFQISLEEHRAFNELTTLFEIGKNINSSLNLRNTLKLVLDNAIELTGTEAGSIALFDKRSGELVIEAAKGFSEDFLDTHCWQIRPGGMTAKIISQSEPLIIEDTSMEPSFSNPIAVREGIRSLVAVPLVFDKNTIGILYVDGFEPRNYSGSEIRLVSILANQAAVAINNAQMHEKTKWLAITDGLTEVYNHRFFHEQLDKEVQRAERYGHSISVIMMDIDYFKNYNDLFGHKKGDQVLRIMAKLLSKYTRKADLVARYGGDEFVVILPETTKEKALDLAERIRIRIEESDLAKAEAFENGRLTVSLGIASYPEDAETASELLDKVDEVLYMAKRSGRNKACLVDKNGGGLYCTPGGEQNAG